MKNPKPSLHAQRVAKEQSFTESEIQDRVRWDLPILAQNSKCSVSLDLPLINCRPTAVCAAVCYAAQGRQAYRQAVLKSVAIQQMIEKDPDRVAHTVVDEAAGRAVRLAGSGEVLPSHRYLVEKIHELGGQTWEFTRRVDTHEALPHLMFSLDAGTPPSALEYIEQSVPVNRRAYLRRPNDPPAPLEVAVTFPLHGPRTPHAKAVPTHPTDCPASRDEVSGCWACRRCY